VIALDPSTGRQRWVFDPKIDQTWQTGDGLVNRGLATWLDDKRPAGAPCRRRLFEATIDARLIAVDAANRESMRRFWGRTVRSAFAMYPGFHQVWYHMTSPAAVVDDVVIVGSAIDDNTRVDMPSGCSSCVRCSYRNPSVELGSDLGGHCELAGTAWSTRDVSVGRRQCLVYHDSGSSAAPGVCSDRYRQSRLLRCVLRAGDDKWANSVVALRADTGELVGGFNSFITTYGTMTRRHLRCWRRWNMRA